MMQPPHVLHCMCQSVTLSLPAAATRRSIQLLAIVVVENSRLCVRVGRASLHITEMLIARQSLGGQHSSTYASVDLLMLGIRLCLGWTQGKQVHACNRGLTGSHWMDKLGHSRA